MHLIRLIWFLLWNLRFETTGGEARFKLRGLHVSLDIQGNVQLRAERDLRLNARFVMTQCAPDFEPDHSEQPATADTIEPLYQALVHCFEAEALKQAQAPVASAAGGYRHER